MNRFTKCKLLAAAFVLINAGCAETSPDIEAPFRQLRERIRTEFPKAPTEVPVPANNASTPEKIALGEALFFDPNLSSCGTIACATCHLPEQGFSDGRRVSEGCNGVTGRRNSNTIYNTAFASHLFWDGRAQSLEQQALDPVVDSAEMANNWDEVLEYLSTGVHPPTGSAFPEAQAFYETAFEEVFQGDISSTTVSKALAAYERTVISRDAPFDRWLQGDDSALSMTQKRGALVFFGRGRCSECHPPPHFTDFDFHNIGVPKVRLSAPDPFPHNEDLCGGIASDQDPGRAEIPSLRSSCSDLGRFRTPTLRNVELSAPYMHNGAFASLDSVLQHYWNLGRGSAEAPIGTLDKRVSSILLTDFGGQPDDMINLTAFLQGLSGTQIGSPDGGVAPPR